MRKQKIYLETTMFNYYFEKDRDAYKDTISMFREIKDGKYDAYTSIYVITELSNATEEKRSRMLNLITEYNIIVFDLSDAAEALAQVYVDEGIIPERYLTDGVHIAMATVNDLDMILSLNFRHIVKKKTIELTELVNVREGYRKVHIYTPMEVVENE